MQISPKHIDTQKVIIITLIATTLTAISMYNRRFDIKDLSQQSKVLLTINVWFHFTQFLLAAFILFWLPSSFDTFVILIIMIFIPIKYLLYNRKCVVTEKEKQIMGDRFHPRYPGSEPYLQYLNADKLIAFIKIIFFYPLAICTIFIITTRCINTISNNVFIAGCVATLIILFNVYVHLNFIGTYLRMLIS